MENITAESTGFSPPSVGADTLFEDRYDAARRLADDLPSKFARDTIVVAVSHGGTEVAAEVARTLRAPLDIVVVRKIRHPQAPERVLGAVAPGYAVYVRPDTGLTDRQVAIATADARREVDVLDARLHVDRAHDCSRRPPGAARRRRRHHGREDDRRDALGQDATRTKGRRRCSTRRGRRRSARSRRGRRPLLPERAGIARRGRDLVRGVRARRRRGRSPPPRRRRARGVGPFEAPHAASSPSRGLRSPACGRSVAVLRRPESVGSDARDLRVGDADEVIRAQP